MRYNGLFKENRYLLFYFLRYFLPVVKQRAGDEGTWHAAAGHVGWKNNAAEEGGGNLLLHIIPKAP